AAAGAHRWQNGVREAMSVPPLNQRYWFEALTVAIVVAAALLAVPRLVRLLSRRRVTAVALVTLGIGAVTVVVSPGETIGAASSTALPAGLSGGAGSAVSWNRLGREGQKFVSLPA